MAIRRADLSISVLTHFPFVVTRFEQDAGRAAFGTLAACSAGVQHPRRLIEVGTADMSVSVDNRAGPRIFRAKALMVVTGIPDTVAMFNCQQASGKIHLGSLS